MGHSAGELMLAGRAFAEIGDILQLPISLSIAKWAKPKIRLDKYLLSILDVIRRGSPRTIPVGIGSPKKRVAFTQHKETL